MRAVFVPARGYPGDVALFVDWGERIARVGPGSFYEPGYFADYPPAFLYVLWALAAMLDGETLRLAIKAISIPADIAIALICATLVWRHGSPSRAVLAAALWSFAPGAIIAGPYWGQVDAVGTLVALVALLATASKRWISGGALAGVAAVLKFQYGLALVIVVAASAVEAFRTRSPRPLLAIPAAAVEPLPSRVINAPTRPEYGPPASATTAPVEDVVKFAV